MGSDQDYYTFFPFLSAGYAFSTQNFLSFIRN